ncbi:PGAP1-like protein [Lentzea atacamensis]|uniref:PGAP1-like protein n=1 Tax=Lentzea atacamensis TaxID=531938 RepID=A0A316ISW4_9PSEU|nr:alpha/beta hydrolase [Lentzea atacamensis]PWK90245.1 PGAP1-like protein [Lentzea atacamensis]
MTEPAKPSGVTNVDVSGGMKSTTVQCDDLLALSRLTDEVGEDTLKIAAAGHKFLVEPNVLASSLLNPGGVVKFEAAMAVALDGPHGLTATSAGIRLRGEALKASKIAYEMADELAAKSLEVSRWFAGKAVTATPTVAAATALLTGGAIAADVHANYDGDWMKWLMDHPGMVDNLIGMTPGMISSLGIPVDLATTLDLLAATYPDGNAVVTPSRSHPHADVPKDLHDLMEGLAMRNKPDVLEPRGKDEPVDPANIDVRIIKNAQNEVTGYVVDIPGTKHWNPPGVVESANDTGVNVDAMAGNRTVLQKGIEEALRMAGATDGKPVMLLGHSQGGIVAAQSTPDLVASGYNVTHVVTAGSPVGRIDVPANVQMLSLENRNDIVPRLDAADNPDTANRTTVKFDQNYGDFKNHNIEENYSEAARQLSDPGSKTYHDPAVAKYRDSLGAFTNGSQAETRTYRVTREGVN